MSWEFCYHNVIQQFRASQESRSDLEKRNPFADLFSLHLGLANPPRSEIKLSVSFAPAFPLTRVTGQLYKSTSAPKYLFEIYSCVFVNITRSSGFR